MQNVFCNPAFELEGEREESVEGLRTSSSTPEPVKPPAAGESTSQGRNLGSVSRFRFNKSYLSENLRTEAWQFVSLRPELGSVCNASARPRSWLGGGCGLCCCSAPVSSPRSGVGPHPHTWVTARSQQGTKQSRIMMLCVLFSYMFLTCSGLEMNGQEVEAQLLSTSPPRVVSAGHGQSQLSLTDSSNRSEHYAPTSPQPTRIPSPDIRRCTRCPVYSFL